MAAPTRPGRSWSFATPLGAARIVRAPRTTRNAPPTRPRAGRAPTRAAVNAVRPNAAMPPYDASAGATPTPDASPYARPWASVRRIVRRLIGPTAIATVNPIAMPLVRVVAAIGLVFPAA